MDRRYDPDTTTPDIDAERARVPRGEWLVGAGEMAESIRSLDWSSTPLGPREHWPESLRTVVNLLVASRFPMALLWGRELLLIYNDAYRVVAGGKHPAALGRSTREIWPEVWHVNEPILAAVVDRGETVYLEDACFPINRHGYPEDAYFTLCYAPVRVESGAVGGALATLEETTARVAERKHAREAVRESTALLQAISDTSADVIFAKDRVGRIRFANPATLAVIGKTAAEVIGKTDAEFLGDSAAARAVMENDRRIMERGVSEDVEERVPLPDGTHRIWFSRKSPLRDATGEVVGLVGISRDITDRKRAEEAVRAGEERYRNLFTNMTEGFAVGEPILDDAGVLHDVRLLEMNAAFERHTGLDIARTRGRPLREVLPEIEPEWIEAYGAVALSGRPVRFENYNRALDRHFDVYCYRPAPGQFAIVFTDVTAKKRAEEASTREHELLTRLVERLPVMITMYHPRLGGFRFNDEFQRVLGWTEEDAASGDLMARAYPDPKVREEAAEHMTSVAPGWRELPVVAKDGTVVPSTWANLRLSDDTQVGIGIDLRDRKRREQESKDALARAEQHGALLAAMMDHIPMGITIADAPDVNIRAVSRYGRELLDKSSAELTNIPAEQHPDAWAVFRADGVTRASAEELPLTRATVNGEVISGEEWVVARRDGTRIPILCTAAPIRDGRGSITGGVIGWQDLTERKRAEERLRGALEAAEAERRRLEAVLEALPAGVALADATGRITLFNDAHRHPEAESPRQAERPLDPDASRDLDVPRPMAGRPCDRGGRDHGRRRGVQRGFRSRGVPEGGPVRGAVRVVLPLPSRRLVLPEADDRSRQPPAIGGAFDLACLCDVRIASKGASFGHPEIKLGAPPLFTPLRWIVGDGIARDLCLTGRRIGAEEALRLRLVSDVVDADGLLVRATQVATSILEAPTRALHFAKGYLVANAGMSFEASFHVEHDRAFQEVILKDRRAPGDPVPRS